MSFTSELSQRSALALIHSCTSDLFVHIPFAQLSYLSDRISSFALHPCLLNFLYVSFVGLELSSHFTQRTPSFLLLLQPSFSCALIPFGATLGEGAAACYGQFPKAVALGERTAAFPAIAEWMKNEYCNLKKPPRAKRQ